MKIVFLDIDGVLIPYPIGRNRWNLNPILVGKLKRLVKKHKASIVLSAACRQYDFPRRIRRSFSEAGWKNPPIIGKTPRLDNRGEEILDWLSKNPAVGTYIIIDDTTFDLLPPLTNIIRTDSKIGISDEDVALIDEIWADK